MSTKVTTSPIADLIMVDSAALRLSQSIASYQARQVEWLLTGLLERGFADLNATHLGFISVMDCADNIASEIARRLNISRQAVHKTLRELEDLGYVETAPNPKQRNSRVIRFTAKGETLIAAARQMFAELDTHIDTHLSPDQHSALIELLAAPFPA